MSNLIFPSQTIAGKSSVHLALEYLRESSRHSCVRSDKPATFFRLCGRNKTCSQTRCTWKNNFISTGLRSTRDGKRGAELCHSGIKLFYRLKGENKPTRRFRALVLFYFRSHLSLAGAVHHRRRPQDTAVILVQVAVFWSLEVFQHKHVLELAVLPVAKFSDIVGFDTGGVYILMKSRSRKCSVYESIQCLACDY